MDQPPGPSFKFTAADLKARVREIIVFLPQFLRRPVEGMKRVPSWDWPTALILEAGLAATTSVLRGFVDRSVYEIFGGLFVGPVRGIVISFILAGIFYYSCLFLLKTELEFRKIFVVVVLALVPSQILEILSPLAHPVTVIGVILSALLLIVGLVENFMLDKKKITQIVGTLAGAIILIWLYGAVMEATTNRIRVQDYTPESLDQIHRELEQNK
jgi:hypothetical protein